MSINTLHRAGAEPGEAKALVILLHGLGANGLDLLGLAPHWAQAADDIAFVAPDAPFACDMAPVGFQWFSLADRDPQVVLRGVEQAAPMLSEWIDSIQAEYGVDDSRTVLMGFSQGSMMSLYVATRRDVPFAGVMAYSGALAAIPGKTQPPILLVHGRVDPVVPFAAYETAYEGLTQAGFDVHGVAIDDLPHGIDQTGVEEGVSFLTRVLGD